MDPYEVTWNGEPWRCVGEIGDLVVLTSRDVEPKSAMLLVSTEEVSRDDS